MKASDQDTASDRHFQQQDLEDSGSCSLSCASLPGTCPSPSPQQNQNQNQNHFNNEEVSEKSERRSRDRDDHNHSSHLQPPSPDYFVRSNDFVGFQYYDSDATVTTDGR
jgi:hypothetical protein